MLWSQHTFIFHWSMLANLYFVYCVILALASAQTTVTLTSSVEQAERQAACPGEEVTFTCVTGTAVLQWIAEPHINQSNPVSFSGASATAGDTRDSTAQIHIVLVEVNPGSDPRFRTFVSTLTVRNSTALNGTVIQCSNGINTVNNSLIVGTPPSSPQNARSGDVGYSISDFTVAVQWESPASVGGVGIDSYTLTGAGITVPLTVLSSELLMATLTLSYNEMHMVSITASNCAGESIAAVVTIQEVGCAPPTPPPRGSLGDLTSSQEGGVVIFQCNPGLAPSQQMMSVCAANGSWTPDPAEQTCDCGVPESPTDGTVAYTTTTEESLATFQCSAGLVPVALMTAVCEESGGVARWSPDPGELSCIMGQDNTTAPPEASSDPAVVIAVAVVVVVAVSVAVVATVIIVYLCWRKRSSGAFVVKTEAAADVSYDYARVTGRGVEMDSLANRFYDRPDTQKPAAERLENATDGFYSYADTRRLPPPQAPESILREAAPGTGELYTVPEMKKGSKKKKEATPTEYSEVDMKKKHQPPSGDKAGEASAEEYSQLQRQKAPKGVIDLSDPTYSHLQTGSRAVRTSLEETSPLPARLEPEGVAPPHPPKSPVSGPPRPACRSRRRTPERNIEMPSRPPKPAPYRGDQ